MGFFNDLFSCAQSSRQTPLGNYLTEILCHFLNRLDCVSQAEILKVIFKIECAQSEIVWQTPYPTTIAGRSANKRPGLVGNGKIDGAEAFIFIENKIGTGFTVDAHIDDQRITQLVLYKEHLDDEKERAKQPLRSEILLLNQPTSEPIDWNPPIIYWWEFYDGLKIWLSSQDSQTTVQISMADEIINFLAENHMGPISLDLSDIASFHHWKKLREGCCDIAEGVIRPILESHKIRDIFVMADLHQPISRSYNMFAGYYPADSTFMGIVFTPNGNDIYTSFVTFWVGVLLSETYHIRPDIPDIPEINIGLEIQTFEEKISDAYSLCQGLVHSLNALTSTDHKNATWSLREPEVSQYNPKIRLVGFNRNLPFSDLYGKENWNYEIKSFVQSALDQLSTLPIESLKNIVSYHLEYSEELGEE